MEAIKIYQVDAFTENAFRGNPAAVCILSSELSEERMLDIAKEMNLSETAFVLGTDREDTYNLRWFTPKVEVALCGHATLSAAKIIFEEVNSRLNKINFITKSGVLIAERQELGIKLDFPLDEPCDIEVSYELLAALGLESYERAAIGKTTRKLILQIDDVEKVMTLKPDYEKMIRVNLKERINGVAVTAKDGDKYDFISRYFNPWMGVNEDPVTGSVHTVLVNFWRRELHKEEMSAYQASERGGELSLKINDSRVEIIGKSIIILKGELFI